jgi:hypothetical protein
VKHPSLLLLSLLAALPSSALAETQLCTKIASIPAVLSTQGSYCLSKDLSTVMTEGVAVQIAANNVTLDCNGYKLGNLGGGAASTAIAIQSTDRQNTVVRNCGIRGFLAGIELLTFSNPYPRGHLVERNRLDGVLAEGITVFGDASTVRDNVVADTGGGAGGGQAIGIRVEGGVDVIGNVVDGVVASGEDNAYGIYTLTNARAEFADNRVRNIVSPVQAYGIHAELFSDALIVRGNTVADPAETGGVGIDCNLGNNIAMRNEVSGFTTPIDECMDGGGNVLY